MVFCIFHLEISKICTQVVLGPQVPLRPLLRRVPHQREGLRRRPRQVRPGHAHGEVRGCRHGQHAHRRPASGGFAQPGAKPICAVRSCHTFPRLLVVFIDADTRSNPCGKNVCRNPHDTQVSSLQMCVPQDTGNHFLRCVSKEVFVIV